MNWRERLIVDPDINHGHLSIRGTRIRAIDIFALLANGVTAREILADYPDLVVDDILAVIAFLVDV